MRRVSSSVYTYIVINFIILQNEQLLLLSALLSLILFKSSNKSNMDDKQPKVLRAVYGSSVSKPLWDLTIVSVCTESLAVFSLKLNLRWNSDYVPKLAENENGTEPSVRNFRFKTIYYWENKSTFSFSFF